MGRSTIPLLSGLVDEGVEELSGGAGLLSEFELVWCPSPRVCSLEVEVILAHSD